MPAQYEWLDGLYDWYDETPFNQWGRSMVDAATPFMQRPLAEQIKGAGQGIAQIGSQAANTTAAGLGALTSLPYAGLDKTVAGLDMRTNPNNPNYNPLIPTYQAPEGAGQEFVGSLGAAAAPVAAAGPALGNLAFEATGNPGFATAAHIAPEAALAAIGLRNPKLGRGPVNPNELFPGSAPEALPGPKSPLFDVEGVTGRGGPGRFQEGAVKVTGGTPDDPQYGRVSTGTLAPREQLIRRHDTPDAPFVSSIPEAMERMSRYRPAQGNAWYKELVREGVTPEEIKFFGLDDLKGSDKLVTKEEVYEKFNSSANDMEAWRSSTTGNVSNELFPPQAEGNTEKPDHLAYIRDFPTSLEDTGELQGELRERALAAGVSPERVSAALDDTNVGDLRRYAEMVIDNPGETRYANELMGEIEYQRGRMNNPAAFDDIYEDFIRLANSAKALGGEDSSVNPYRMEMESMRVGRYTPGFEDYSRIPGSLSEGVTRFMFPESEYGNVGSRDYSEDVYGDLGDIGRYGGDKSKREETLNYMFQNDPDYEGMPGYGIIGKGPQHYARYSNEPMLRSGSKPLVAPHKRPSRHALFPEEFLKDEQGNPYVETIAVAEEMQYDDLQKRDKWNMRPGTGGVNRFFDADQNKRDLEALDQEMAEIRDRKNQMRDRYGMLKEGGDIDRAMEVWKNVGKVSDDIRYLETKRRALEDKKYAGSPDTPFSGSDQEWKLLLLKEEAINAVKQGDEWVTMPIPWSSAQSHGDLVTARGIAWTGNNFVDGEGRRISDEMMEAVPQDVRNSAKRRYEEVSQSYTPEEHFKDALNSIKDTLRRKANERFDHVAPVIRYRRVWDDPDTVMYAGSNEFGNYLRRDPDVELLGMENAVLDDMDNRIAEFGPNDSLEEMRDDWLEGQISGVTPGNINRVADALSGRRLVRRSDAVKSYDKELAERSVVPFTVRHIADDSPHKNIMENAYRDQRQTMEKFLRDLGYSEEQIKGRIQEVPMRVFREREMIPAIRLDEDVQARMEQGVPLFGRLPEQSKGRSARRQSSVRRRQDNPESLLFRKGERERLEKREGQLYPE